VATIAEHLVGGTDVRFAAGEHLFRTGDPADRFFLIRHGSVALDLMANGRPHVIETLHESEIAGFSWLFEPRRWLFDGRAVHHTEVTMFLAADQQLDGELMRHFAGIAVSRLQAARLQLLDVYGSPGR
jgi:CRP/FNR family transcriptional regulator, cyclic AMP receptor protein